MLSRARRADSATCRKRWRLHGSGSPLSSRSATRRPANWIASGTISCTRRNISSTNNRPSDFIAHGSKGAVANHSRTARTSTLALIFLSSPAGNRLRGGQFRWDPLCPARIPSRHRQWQTPDQRPRSAVNEQSSGRCCGDILRRPRRSSSAIPLSLQPLCHADGVKVNPAAATATRLMRLHRSTPGQFLRLPRQFEV